MTDAPWQSSSISEAKNYSDYATPMATVALLEERVTNHIKFFWTTVAVGFAWLAALSAFIYNMNTTITRVERAKADEPFKILAMILDKHPSSPEEVASTLGVIPVVLKSAQIMRSKPSAEAILKAGTEIVNAQDEYADLPATWIASSAFINYKSIALLGDAPRVSPPATAGCTRTFGAEGWVFAGCEISLEDIASKIQGNKVNGAEAPFTFRRCIVHYRGGPIPAKRLLFVDSVLRFKVETKPDPSGVIALRELALVTRPVYEVVL